MNSLVYCYADHGLIITLETSKDLGRVSCHSPLWDLF